VACWEQDGFAYVVLRLRDARRCEFEVEAGDGPSAPVVLRNGTHDVLDLVSDSTGLRVAVRMFGRQTIDVKVPFVPSRVDSGSPALIVRGLEYDRARGTARIDVSGRNIHGEEGELVIRQ
jgi:hypothetical protein